MRTRPDKWSLAFTKSIQKRIVNLWTSKLKLTLTIGFFFYDDSLPTTFTLTRAQLYSFIWLRFDSYLVQIVAYFICASWLSHFRSLHRRRSTFTIHLRQQKKEQDYRTAFFCKTAGIPHVSSFFSPFLLVLETWGFQAVDKYLPSIFCTTYLLAYYNAIIIYQYTIPSSL